MFTKSMQIINLILLSALTFAVYNQSRNDSAPEGEEGVNAYSQEVAEFLPTEYRTANVAGFLLSQGLPLNYEVREYLSKVQKEIVRDTTNLQFHDVVYEGTGAFTAGKVKDMETITLYNEWDVKLGKDSAFFDNFPRIPILAVNFETIKQPECDGDAKPFLLWAKATRNGETWDEDPVVIKNDEKNTWRVVFKDLKVLDERSFDRRLFTVTYCANPEGEQSQ